MADNFNDWMRYQTADVVERLKNNGDEVYTVIIESMTESPYIDSARLGYLISNLMNQLHDEYVDECIPFEHDAACASSIIDNQECTALRMAA